MGHCCFKQVRLGRAWTVTLFILALLGLASCGGASRSSGLPLDEPGNTGLLMDDTVGPTGQAGLGEVPRVLSALDAMTAAVELPVSADFEAGFAVEPDDVAANVLAAAATFVILKVIDKDGYANVNDFESDLEDAGAVGLFVGNASLTIAIVGENPAQGTRQWVGVAASVASLGITGLPEGFDLHTSRGLGLQIARTLVEKDLGGKLVLVNETDGGTNAWVQFPRGVAAESEE